MVKWLKKTGFGREGGIAGIEVAVILIAFVSVAAVFAYMVISAGLESSEENRKAIDAGLESSTSALISSGAVLAKDVDGDRVVDEVLLTLGNVLTQDSSIDLSVTTDTNRDGLLSDEADPIHTTIISYVDQTGAIHDLAWTKAALGREDGDALLEPGERFLVTVSLAALPPANRLEARDTFVIEVRPDNGGTITFSETIPALVSGVMVLN